MEFIIIGTIILIYYIFFKSAKKSNFELNFKESILFILSTMSQITLILEKEITIALNLNKDFMTVFSISLQLLLVIYYIIRSIKLKKYTPIKSIISYIIMTIATFLCSGFVCNNVECLNLYAIFVMITLVQNLIFIGLLLLINIIISGIAKIKKEKVDNNTNYKIITPFFINIVILIIFIYSLLGINIYINFQNQKQSDIVLDYLNTKYPDYYFEIIEIDTYRDKGGKYNYDGEVYINNIKNNMDDKIYEIVVKKEDLTICYDSFEVMYEKKKAKSKEEKIVNYLKEKYNIEIKYQIDNNKMEEVEFIINRDYKEDEINLFTQEMKQVFNYIEENFIDISYVKVNFINGNPFYAGEHEYYKKKGYINNYKITKLLFIDVCEQYIFIEK